MHPGCQMEPIPRHGRNDTEVRIAPGGSFVLELPVLATAGYTWGIATMPDVIVLREERIRPTGAALGAPSMQEFEFRATRSGSGVLTLQLRRHWESSVAETLVLTVVVAGVS